jgi:hypothetical protein
MTRQRWVLYIFAGAVAVALLCAYAWQRRATFARILPGALDGTPPPEGVAAQITTLTDGEMRAVYGVPTFTGACSMNTARSDYMRTWPGHLADCPDSLIRGEFTIAGEFR